MKTSISQEKPKFSPVTLSITVETEEELRMLRAIFGGSSIRQCSNWINGVTFDQGLNAKKLHDFITKAFSPVHDLCVEKRYING